MISAPRGHYPWRGHYERAEESLQTSRNHTDSSDPGDNRIATHMALQGIGWALLALVPLVREISDQLDTFPRPGPQCAYRDPVGGRRCHLEPGHDGGHRIGVTR